MVEKSTARAEESSSKHGMQNLDKGSTLAFGAAALMGAIGVANNVRNSFWQIFVLGNGKHKSPFSRITDEHQALFTKQTTDYNRGAITASAYKANVRNVATNYRNTVADKLLREFDIPTHGVKGWTVGTWKRLNELSLTGRIQSVVGFASVAAITCGAINVLRNSRNTIDRIEDKIDAGHHSR
jgi:hypothetical protein